MQTAALGWRFFCGCLPFGAAPWNAVMTSKYSKEQKEGLARFLDALARRNPVLPV
ncbi:hypothetical protein [Comamonas faecalis]|uniref:hypothetical protein n=1 Tax=Comamonas faecalis TaxID=1387849 RepID=UPI0031F04C8D